MTTAVTPLAPQPRSRAFAIAVGIGVALALAGVVAGCSAAGPVTGAGPSPYTPPDATATMGAIPLAGKVPRPASGAYLGAYVPPVPFPSEGIDAYEKSTGKSVSIVMWYQPWAATNRSKFDTSVVVAMMRRGKIPMITWEPWDPGNNARTVVNPGNQRDYRLSRINSGAFDDYIRGWARDIRALGGPVMLRPMHEMNGDWYPWCGPTNGNSPAAYVAAWRRIHDIFRSEGATNVTWVWSINRESVPASRVNTFAAYYPGDSYVDWTAISGFNGATSTVSPLWKSWTELYSKPLAYLATVGKPICIAEMATLGTPREKEVWITDAYARIAADPRVDAVVYFESLEIGKQRQDWRAAADPVSLNAYRDGIAPSRFVGSTPPVLKTWADSLSIDQWRYLTSFEPVY